MSARQAVDELRWVTTADLPGLRLPHPACADVVRRLVGPGSTVHPG